MSQSLGQTIQVWQDVTAMLRRKSVSWQGNPLSERDQRTFTDAIVMCALHLTDMSSQVEGIGNQREIIAWAHNMHTLDVSDLGSFLSDVVLAIRRVAEPTTINEFKRPLMKKYPFVGMFLSPIREALDTFLQCPSPSGFQPCYQFFSFLTHLSLQDLGLDLEGEYKELEAYLHTIRYPSSYLREMNGIMREWMESFLITEESFIPSHGPGGTAETLRRQSSLNKYLHLGTNQLIDYVFSKYAGFSVESFYPFPSTHWEPESKLVFVPKSMKTRRSISKEPATLQYLQQGVSKELDRYIHSHPYLQRHIFLHDQSVNGTLAVEGSRTGQWSTIDLSSASDVVTLELVKSVFYGTPVYPFLVALRSKTVLLPSGESIGIAKYAPMGSALCFPVETLIFACIVELAIRRAHRYGADFHRHYLVYGDDIIVHHTVFDDVMRTLDSLGFIANESKSFHTPSRFRESCGYDAYDGVEVTPLRISRNFVSPPDRWTSRDAACYEGLIDMANSCHVYDFRLLRAWIIRILLDDTAIPPLFSKEGNGSVYSPMPDNFRAPRRFNLNLQRMEVLIKRSRSRSKEKTASEEIETARLFETLRLSHTRDGDMFDPAHLISVPSSPVDILLSNVWVLLPDGGLSIAEVKSLLSDNQSGEGEKAH